MLIRRCALVVAISHPTRRQLIEGLHIPAGKVVVAHPGVAKRFFGIASSELADRLRVLFVGSLSREKGPLAALAVFEHAAARSPMSMRFVGGGPLISELSQAVVSRGLTASVDIVGPVDDVEPHLEWAEVILLTSETEGIPGVVLEGGAAGVPTAAFDVGGLPDVILDDETGMLVDSADVSALADQLVRLSDDPALRTRLSEGVRQKISREFTLKAALDRYDQTLRRLISSPRSVNGESR